MTLSKSGLCLPLSLLLAAVVIAPLAACESESSNNGALTPDTGVFGTDSGDGGTNNGDSSVASECVPPTKGPTMHGGGSISLPDEVWTADTSPHILPFDTTIYKTVTVEPCAEVLIADGKTLTVRGKLVAEGTPSKRIHIGGKDAGKPFRTIGTVGAGPTSIRLAYATIDGGGSLTNTAIYNTGVLTCQGTSATVTDETLFVDHVTIDGSPTSGVVLASGAGFAAGSKDLVVKGVASHPIVITPRSVLNIPVGTYTGNGKDQILLSGSPTITETTTLRERGVPYLYGHALSDGDLRVDQVVGQPPVTLTIEPGVTMRFKKGGVFHTAVASGTAPARASLVAVGTAAKPIVFTSDEATPAAGDWLGLRFGEMPTATTKLDFVRVEYAGGSSSAGSGSCPYDPVVGNNEGAIRITGRPPSQFITNTTITDSLLHGIDRGWRSDAPEIDFLPTNTFTNVGNCKQTFPPTAGNVCPPQPVPCP